MNNYTFIAPVPYVAFAKTYSPKELAIGRVMFVCQQRLPLIRKRLGIRARFSEIRIKDRIDPDFLKRSDTYAIIQLHATDKNTPSECFKRITEALTILGVSQLGWSKRRYHKLPLQYGFTNIGRFDYLLFDNKNPRQFPGWQILGVPSAMILNTQWKQYHKQGFFFRLLDIVNNKITISESWKRQIEKAAILIGQS